MNKKLFTLMFLMFLLVVPFISAWDFDNVKNYNEETKTIEIRNSVLGIPFLQLSKVAEIQLISSQNEYVIRGKDRLIAEFEIRNVKDYKKVFKNLEFYNIKENEKKFERDYIYRYKEFYNVEIIDYEEVCSEKVNVNGSIEKYDCFQKEIGNH